MGPRHPGVLLCTRADKRSSIFRYFCGWDMIANICPQILLVVSCKSCEAELGSDCLSRSKGVSWGPTWPFLQVPVQITATDRDGHYLLACTQPEGQLLSHTSNTNSAAHAGCQVRKREFSPLFGLRDQTERMSTNANCPYLHYLKHMDPFSFKLTKYLLGRPISIVSSYILYPCAPTLLQVQERPLTFMRNVLSQWLLKYGGGGDSRWPQCEYHLETF